MSESTIKVTTLQLNPLQTNCYLVAGGATALVIDPGGEAERLRESLAAQHLRPTAILLTHAHFDHTGAAAELAAGYEIPVYLGADEAPIVAAGGLASGLGFADVEIGVYRPLQGEMVLDLSPAVVAIPTPGHSAGSYTFAIDGSLFCGDLLFRGSVGRMDLLGGDPAALVASVTKLLERFPAETVVYSGHGPATTLGRELQSNHTLAALRAQYRS